MQSDMKTIAISTSEAVGLVVRRLMPFVLALGTTAGVCFLFSSFIDLVQSWAASSLSGQVLP